MNGIQDKEAMIQYIVRVSTIPEEFVRELFKFYDINTSPNDFVIDLDVVAKWLGTQKWKLYENLRISKTYTRNVDYKEVQGRIEGKSHRYKQVLITPDCFKHMCMLTRSKMGHTVRNYFIEIENLFFKYRQETYLGMEQEINRLARNQRPKNTIPVGGYVYVIRASETKDSLYKIGKTTDLQQRLQSHQSVLADDLEVLYMYKTDNIDAVERCTHAWLKQYKYRKYKEVFQVDLRVIKEVIHKCAGVGTAIKLEKKNASKLSGGYYLVTHRT